MNGHISCVALDCSHISRVIRHQEVDLLSYYNNETENNAEVGNHGEGGEVVPVSDPTTHDHKWKNDGNPVMNIQLYAKRTACHLESKDRESQSLSTKLLFRRVFSTTRIFYQGKV